MIILVELFHFLMSYLKNKRKQIVNIHSHIAIVVTPPSLKSYANQKKLVKSQGGHTEKPFADH